MEFQTDIHIQGSPEFRTGQIQYYINLYAGYISHFIVGMSINWEFWHRLSSTTDIEIRYNRPREFREGNPEVEFSIDDPDGLPIITSPSGTTRLKISLKNTLRFPIQNAEVELDPASLQDILVNEGILKKIFDPETITPGRTGSVVYTFGGAGVEGTIRPSFHITYDLGSSAYPKELDVTGPSLIALPGNFKGIVGEVIVTNTEIGITNATILLLSPETSTKSLAGGYFVLPTNSTTAPGTYELKISAYGFKEARMKKIFETIDPIRTISFWLDYRYIGNKNTKELHIVFCEFLPAKKNRVFFNSIEDAVSEKYNGCYYCFRKYHDEDWDWLENYILGSWVEASEIRDFLITSLRLTHSCDFLFADSKFYCLSQERSAAMLDDLKQKIQNEWPSGSEKGYADLAILAKNFFVRQAYHDGKRKYNYCMAILMGNNIKGEKRAINVLVTKEENIVCLDPRDGSIIPRRDLWSADIFFVYI
ncbi:MAG: hypothetical protein ACFFBD_17135 [Candidatus Hodarchaeota archaeon]